MNIEQRDNEVNALLSTYDINPHTRNSDDLDFHDVAVWTLQEMMRAAYNAGHKDALDENDITAIDITDLDAAQ